MYPLPKQICHKVTKAQRARRNGEGGEMGKNEFFSFLRFFLYLFVSLRLIKPLKNNFLSYSLVLIFQIAKGEVVYRSFYHAYSYLGLYIHAIFLKLSVFSISFSPPGGVPAICSISYFPVQNCKLINFIKI